MLKATNFRGNSMGYDSYASLALTMSMIIVSTNKSALSHCFDRWSLACSILELELLEDRSWSVPAFFPFFTHTMAEYIAWEDRNLLVLCMRLDPYVSVCRLVGQLIDWSVGWLVGWSVSNAFTLWCFQTVIAFLLLPNRMWLILPCIRPYWV